MLQLYHGLLDVTYFLFAYSFPYRPFLPLTPCTDKSASSIPHRTNIRLHPAYSPCFPCFRRTCKKTFETSRVLSEMTETWSLYPQSSGMPTTRLPCFAKTPPTWMPSTNSRPRLQISTRRLRAHSMVTNRSLISPVHYLLILCDSTIALTPHGVITTKM